MSADRRSLLLHLVGGAVTGGAVVLGGGLAGLLLSLPMLLAAGLTAGAALWLLRRDSPRADHSDAPRLDLDVDYTLPHGQDVRVRRLEDLIHGAQPHRRMTGRGLARLLGEIAAEREHHPQAPPLSPALRELIDRAQHPDAPDHPVGAIDRRTLHRHLRELAETGE